MLQQHVVPRLRLLVIEGRFAICKLSSASPIPDWATTTDIFSITRTPDELSIVCRQDHVPAEIDCERDWCCFRVAGAMPFTVVGVLAALTNPLANAGISLFALSTFDTDYLLVKAADAENTMATWRAAGHELTQAVK